MTGPESDRLRRLLATPFPDTVRPGHGPFIPAAGFPTIESRRRVIGAALLTAWLQHRHLAHDPDPILAPRLYWPALLRRVG